MSSNTTRKSKDGEGTRMIPVFTVIKNGAILKNIFVVNPPADNRSSLSSIKFVENSKNLDHEDILIVGRHPDCDIVLMHPSISRFHLQINSNPSVRKFFVTDLSSVHGTWISEKKIDPGFRIEMKEGDTIRMGASTRVYRLHWIPLSRAYDSENPFVSESDLALIREKEEENVETMSLNLLATINKNVEEKDSVLVLEKAVDRYQEEVPSSKSQEMNSIHCVKEEMESSSTSDNELSVASVGGVIMPTSSPIFYDCNQSPEYHSAEEDLYLSDSPSSIGEDDAASKMTKETRNQSFLRNEEKQKVHTSSVQLVQLRLQAGEPSDSFSDCMNKENRTQKYLSASNPQCEEGNIDENSDLNEQVNLQDGSSNGTAATEVLEESQNHNPLGNESLLILVSTDLETEGYSCSPEFLSQSKQTQTPRTHFPEIQNSENIMGSCNRSEKRAAACNIWSRRGKPPSALQLWTIRSRRRTKGDGKLENLENLDSEEKIEEVHTSDKENRTPNASVMRSLKKNTESKPTVRAISSNIEVADEEEYTPDKENHTPSISTMRSKKKSCIDLEDSPISTSDKENRTPVILQERNSARHHFKLEERAPLQPLSSNSEASFPSSAERSSSSINYSQEITDLKSVSSAGEGRRRWIMVTDTSSLFDKETRGALELLQGLKGTHLIIPRIVISELDSLKRCNGLFRRKSEASEVLQWIEECMLKTKWWIHVENARPIAQTPPATPVSQFNNGSDVFELVTPTAEDQILDCAMFYKKVDSESQVALLTNNVTLRIKAMAEGLICETAKEFRDSLVNPFSKRFLWADSSPRGQTWSVFDDVVLKENYYRSPSKKLSKGESAKGLKLVLLHNSQFVKSI